MSMANEIWIFAEQKNQNLSKTAFELLNVAHQIAGGQTLAAVLLGDKVARLAKDLFEHGADKVYLVDSPFLSRLVDDSYARALVDLVKKYQPATLIGSATLAGKSIFPRVAATLGVGLITDVVSLRNDNARLVATRPAYGGNVLQELESRPVGTSSIQLITCRPKAFPETPTQSGKTGEIVEHHVADTQLQSKLKVQETARAEEQTVSLSEADIVVSGGRGLREPANFKLIYDLASAVGGAVGASRAVVDAGWISYSHQVGQTGKTVNPKLYFACGISGAIQHLVGMQTSKVIVAINRDKDAPIFNIATFGIVGDLFEIVPALTKKFQKELKR